MAPTGEQPVYASTDVTVIFVLGGPGAGKGTQCARLVKKYSFAYLSAGDLLRAEQDREESEYGDLIREYIREGKIVPLYVTVKLLENAMRDAMAAKDGDDSTITTDSKKGRFLIDGFPRKEDQAKAFEATVCPARLVLFYDCPEQELEKRLLNRGKTSGRADDNIESIRKRFKTFRETSLPVVEDYEKDGRVIKVDASGGVDDVFAMTVQALEAKLGTDI